MIVNCVDIRSKVIQKIKSKEELKGCKVVFMQVGNNMASNIYINNKVKLCEEVGISIEHHRFHECITEEELIHEINVANCRGNIHGIMVQLPLPSHINEIKVINAIDPKKDIDGFTNINKGKLVIGDESGIVPCTPAGIMDILNDIKIDLKGKNVVIVGRSNIVGKPIAQLLVNKGATVTICNSNTNQLMMASMVANCDVFISAIGKANYFNKDFFKDFYINTKVAIDVGINRNSENKLCGDIDKELYDCFDYITPVPGGIGVMTVLNVIKNIIKCYKNK